MTLRNFFSFGVQSPKTSLKLLYNAAIMLFFWSIFDAIMSYMVPIAITEKGFSQTTMGLIYASSSVFGAIFDFILCKVLKTTHFRRVFLLLHITCLFFPILMGVASGALIFIAAMGVWGLYYDVMKFGTFDFVTRRSDHTDHAPSFGVFSIFKSLGYFVGPLVAGYLVLGTSKTLPYVAALIFLGISFIMYLALIRNDKNSVKILPDRTEENSLPTVAELKLWGKISKILVPILVTFVLLNMIDAFFWTVGPLFSESVPGFDKFGGAFLSVYSITSLLAGWFIGNTARKFGKKRTAFVSLLLGSPLIFSIGLLTSPILILLVEFAGGFIVSFAWPAINAACADYLEEAEKYSKEIDGVTDFFSNIGYVIGPAFAGFVSQTFGSRSAFLVLGVMIAVFSIFLLIFTPKHINIVIDKK